MNPADLHVSAPPVLRAVSATSGGGVQPAMVAPVSDPTGYVTVRVFNDTLDVVNSGSCGQGNGQFDAPAAEPFDLFEIAPSAYEDHQTSNQWLDSEVTGVSVWGYKDGVACSSFGPVTGTKTAPLTWEVHIT